MRTLCGIKMRTLRPLVALVAKTWERKQSSETTEDTKGRHSVMVVATIASPFKTAVSERQQAIDWLRNNGFPALPVAPAQDPYSYHRVVKTTPERGLWEHCPLTGDFKPVPLYTGKNPSFLDRAGKPHLINHQQYQDRLPAKNELRDWFANASNGVGTLGGWQDVIWIDFDVKQFDSQEDCDRAARSILERPELQGTFVERTHSGGWRIGVRPKSKPNFTNFSLTPGGEHVGEALGAGRFTVLAPTLGPSGNTYKSIRRAMPVEVESLESIGIFSTKGEQERQPEHKTPAPTLSLIPGAIPLEMLGNDTSRAILNGDCPTGDRSEALVTAIREWHGWRNWASANGIAIGNNVETLAHYAGTKLGIDSDRVERILKTVTPEECQPAALYRGSEESCWKKICRLDKPSFEAKCPAHIKDAIASEWKIRRPGGSGDGFGGNGNGGGDDDSGNGFGDDDQPKDNIWNAPVSWNREIGWLVVEERIKIETDPETGELKPVFGDDGKPAKEKVNKFVPKCNFDFQVERELASEDGGGLVLQVLRSFDNPSQQKRVIIKSTEYTEVTRFVDALKTVLGQGIVCTLKKEHLAALIHVRLKEYRDRGGRIYRLAERVGQQSDGTWVFEGVQFTHNGNITTEEESGWIYNPNLGGEDKMPSPQIAPPDPLALKRLVDAMLKFHGSSGIFPALMALGYVAAGVHYLEIMAREGHFPLINMYGDAGSNKSVASQNALALVGWSTKGALHRVTTSAVYEWLKLSGSLPSCLDDPERSRDLDELLKGLYDGRARKVRGNYQEPHSALLVTSNHACGDDQPATLSRLIQIPFYRQSDGDASAWDEMQEAQRLASGALPDLIKLGYPAEEIRQLAGELRTYLPYAHARVAGSLALVTWYAMAVARLAGFPDGAVKSYVISHLCRTANAANSMADSLTDFIDKLHSLHSESLAGPWSVRTVETESGTAVAVNMSTVWPLMDKLFDPTYSRRVIESLIDRAGGKIQSVQKFHRSKDESLTYLRLLLNPRTDCDGNPIPVIEPEMVSRRCVLIPAELAQDFINSWRSHNPEPPSPGGGSDGGGSPPPETPNGGNSPPTPEPNPPVTPVTSSYSQLHEKCNQQDVGGESVSAVSNSSVTFFEKGMGGFKFESSEVREPDQGKASDAGDEPEQLDHTLTFEKNVTGANLEPETTHQCEFQRLHSGCNSDVTGVTGCNQASDAQGAIVPDQPLTTKVVAPTEAPQPTQQPVAEVTAQERAIASTEPKMGDTVRLPDGHLGAIEMVYSDGQMGVSYDSGRKFSMWRPSELTVVNDSPLSPPDAEPAPASMANHQSIDCTSDSLQPDAEPASVLNDVALDRTVSIALNIGDIIRHSASGRELQIIKLVRGGWLADDNTHVSRDDLRNGVYAWF